jgi:hypothetical protein
MGEIPHRGLHAGQRGVSCGTPELTVEIRNFRRQPRVFPEKSYVTKIFLDCTAPYMYPSSSEIQEKP